MEMPCVYNSKTIPSIVVKQGTVIAMLSVRSAERVRLGARICLFDCDGRTEG